MEQDRTEVRAAIMPKYVALGIWIDKLRGQRLLTREEYKACRDLVARRYIAEVFASRKRES